MIHLPSRVDAFNQREHSPPPPSRKRRNILVILLIVQLLLLFLIFPLLFVHFENKQSQQVLEPTTETDLSGEPIRYRSYADGLYWSMITPIPLSTNDNWPQTSQGRLLVRVSDVTKLLTLGVSAGLIYDSIMARRLQEISRWRQLRYRRPEEMDELPEQEVEREWTFMIDGERVTLRLRSLRRIAPTLIAIFFEKKKD
jgi:hypothetical protein